MRHYLLSVYQPDTEPPAKEKLDEIIRDTQAVDRAMHEAGVWVFSGGLHAPASATVLRARGEKVVTTDGPFLEGKEYFAGFSLIRAADLDEALDWGRKLAVATTLPIEVRPFASEPTAPEGPDAD